MPLFNDQVKLPIASHPGFLSGKYYASASYSSFSSSILTLGFCYYTYFFIPFDQTFFSLAFQLNTATSSTQKARIAIYTINNGLPSSLVKDFGETSINATGTKEFLNYTFLSAGWYAVALTTNETVASFLCPALSLGNLIGFPNVAAGNYSGFRAVLAYPSSYPTTAPVASLVATPSPVFWLKTA